MRRKLGALADALVGRFSDHHAFYCRQVLDHLDFINKMITDLGGRIDAETAAYEPQIALLDTVPGIDRRGAQTILAEIGPEMHRFASRVPQLRVDIVGGRPNQHGHLRSPPWLRLGHDGGICVRSVPIPASGE